MNTRLLVAAACVAALTACATDAETAGPPLRLSSGVATGAAPEVVKTAPGADATMSSRWYEPTFEIDEALRTTSLPTTATGYRSVVVVDDASIEALSSSFGIVGTPVEDEYGFTVESATDDGVRASLYVDRTGGWWYSSYDQPWGCAAPAATSDRLQAEVVTTEPCAKPSKPTGSISESEARAEAEAIFTASGRGGLLLEVTAAPDTGFGENVYVHGIETVGDYKTGRTFEVGFTAGRIAWASGTLDELVALGSYDLVAFDAVEERIADHRYVTWGAYDPQYWLRAASSTIDARSPDVGLTSGTGESGVEEDRTIDGAPAVTVVPASPAPVADEPTVTRLDTMELVLGVFSQDDEPVYLPSVHLTGPDGAAWTVLAVVDGVLEFAEPSNDIAPIEPLPLPVVDFDPTTVIGRPEQAAFDDIEEAGLSVRIVARDGEEFAVTMDYLPNRVNLSVADGVVVDATIG